MPEKAPDMLLHLLVRLSFLSEDRDQARAVSSLRKLSSGGYHYSDRFSSNSA